MDAKQNKITRPFPTFLFACFLSPFPRAMLNPAAAPSPTSNANPSASTVNGYTMFVAAFPYAPAYKYLVNDIIQCSYYHAYNTWDRVSFY